MHPCISHWRSGSSSIVCLTALIWVLVHIGIHCAAQRCDLTTFQGNASSPPKAAAAACRTCVFPVYQRVKGMDASQVLGLDLTDQWVYFYGDSTMRQLHAEFMAYMDSSQDFVYPGEQAPAPTAHAWTNQTGRCNYVPPPYDPTPCYFNQLTCESQYAASPLGRNVRVTYNWKHLLYEDYDRALFGSLPAAATPSMLVTSPGTHDCMHYPAEFYHHGLEMRRFAQHLHLLNTTVVWVDTTPFSPNYGTGLSQTTEADVSTLSCVQYINEVAYDLARELGFYLFSRQTLLLSGNKTDEDGHFPLHQPPPVVKEELYVLLTWLGCVQRDPRFASF